MIGAKSFKELNFQGFKAFCKSNKNQKFQYVKLTTAIHHIIYFHTDVMAKLYIVVISTVEGILDRTITGLQQDQEIRKV